MSYADSAYPEAAQKSVLRSDTGAVTRETERYVDLVRTLDEHVSALRVRLHPILTESADALVAEMRPSPVRCALAGLLADTNDTLERLLRSISELHASVDL